VAQLFGRFASCAVQPSFEIYRRTLLAADAEGTNRNRLLISGKPVYLRLVEVSLSDHRQATAGTVWTCVCAQDPKAVQRQKCLFWVLILRPRLLFRPPRQPIISEHIRAFLERDYLHLRHQQSIVLAKYLERLIAGDVDKWASKHVVELVCASRHIDVHPRE
jgi:hypothetical protein